MFNHPPPCAPILTLSHGPHPACAAHVRNLNAAPGACSPHDMSRPVSTSACGLAMEPSNGVHTTPTQVTHNHHHHHHHHHHRSLLRRLLTSLLTQMTGLGARSTSLRKVSAVRLAGGGGASRRARAATHHMFAMIYMYNLHTPPTCYLTPPPASLPPATGRAVKRAGVLVSVVEGTIVLVRR